MNKKSKIYVAGHTGMVGSAIVRKLELEGYTNLVLRSHQELDLLDQGAVRKFFEKEKPEYVFLAAAKVGGILANNTYRAQFIYENLQIQNNVIHSAYLYGVKKLLFLGSSCIYPKHAPQPIKEEYLLTGPLEPTNEPYAIAKIAGIKMCCYFNEQYGTNFISVMPTNLYGPNDNFNLETGHVLPALLRKIHEAKEDRVKRRKVKLKNKRSIPSVVEVWGTGKPKREFLYIEDLADAVCYLMNQVDAKDLNENGISHINIGTGKDLSIAELVDVIKKVVGYEGKIEYDTTKPDGTPRKLLDVTRLHELGWKHKISLEEGIEKTYKWYLKNKEKFKK
jgi:GDP-L-fucose synthase